MNILNNNNYKNPIYTPAKLDTSGFIISFNNLFNIKKSYKEILGLEHIDHVSINIVNSRAEMTIISLNPSIAHAIINDGSYIYNGSISPDFYMNKDFYTWEEAYDPNFKALLKGKKDVCLQKKLMASMCYSLLLVKIKR